MGLHLHKLKSNYSSSENKQLTLHPSREITENTTSKGNNASSATTKQKNKETPENIVNIFSKTENNTASERYEST